MINIGNIVEGEIIDFTHEGNGVLKIDNLAVFIPGGLIGDKVTVRIDDIKRNYALGSLVNIVKPSKDRIELDFDIAESRGGIPFIQYDYQKQLEWKRDKVINDLAKIAGITDIKVKDTIGMDIPYRYRNHVQIPVGLKDGETVIGFYETASNDIVDIKESVLHPEIGDRIIGIIREWMDKFKVKPYDKDTKKGIVRHLGLRFNRDNEVMVIIVTGSNKLPYENELVEMLKKENVISLYHNINKQSTSPTYGKEYKKIYGEDKLLDYIGEHKFYLSPNSFFQANRTQAEILYDKVVEYLNPNSEDVIFDLYCGIGSISLYLGDKAKTVYGVETVKEAVEDAKLNAELNDLNNVEFIRGRAEIIFPKMLEQGVKGNKIVVDPPRKGCDKEVLQTIVELNPERVVYVSCNPSTMARDIKYLVKNGYKLMEVQPLDMFCHTAHVEAVILLVKE